MTKKRDFGKKDTSAKGPARTHAAPFFFRLLAPGAGVERPLRLGRSSARGEAAQRRDIAQGKIPAFASIRCWRPLSLVVGREFFYFASSTESLSTTFKRLTAMLATLSANEERMTGLLKLPKGEGEGEKGGGEPKRGGARSDFVLGEAKKLWKERERKKKCSKEKGLEGH